jgi:hypothetical protein
VTDTLLFLHLLSAAALVAAVVTFSAVALGAELDRGVWRVFLVLWQVGMVGVLVFGLALAIDIDGYNPWDAWVLIAIALWLAAGGTGEKVAAAHREGDGAVGALPSGVARAHWIHVALVVLLLADMVWKPWA